MGRLSRAEQQEITRTRVLDAARGEFTAHGFRGATVDGIAERAELTRGAVYSNFPGKRALYLAVLAREADQVPLRTPQEPAASPRTAIGMFASTWTDRLPRSDRYSYTAAEQLSSPVLSIDLVPEIQSDERIRRPFAQMIKLDAVLLGLALESFSSPTSAGVEHYIRTAESLLTILYGATQLSFAAPGFVDPPHIVALCEQVASLEAIPTSPHDQATCPQHPPVDEIWTAPECFDVLHGANVKPNGDRMIAVLGLNKIAAIQDMISCTPMASITLALVTDDRSGELVPLTQLALTDFIHSLRYAFPEHALPDIQVVIDESGALATACGLGTFDDDTEASITLAEGRITSRVVGHGACST